ncbi:hypothetical protein ANO11243_084050 [Dothideomycetidae sp. 11243]|nr:hypothetical protein ANO11243_084050 [fungal sp. No.11243]
MTANGVTTVSSTGTTLRSDKRRTVRDGSARAPKRNAWKKLLWVKQAYPDNYTDELQFLSHLQRNPTLRPYEFWPLVADSTIIVQHVASVIIFICCFVGIFQERVSPVSVVSWATIGTVLGWVARDWWIGRHPNGAPTFATYSHYPPYEGRTSRFSPRNQERLATAKSAVLIYCALLGLSPILKSLTKSTSPDSIWAMSSWLIAINVFTFDYGAGPEAKFPAPLSTNAALMASTVLASRLPSTTHVFSLTLFSIEVFGLFPVFRRLLRHVSWHGHLALTAVLIVGAGGALCVTITGGAWPAAVIGVVLGGVLTCLAMGMTSWWLIGLQRFKNEIRGPWDPARPVIRRRWD